MSLTEYSRSLSDTGVINSPFHFCMLTFAAALVGLWFLGLVTSVTLGGFIHLLLVVAVVTAMVRIIEGGNPLEA